MPKPTLLEPDRSLANDIFETFMAGHHEWRPDLSYPQSASDVQGGVLALLKMFKITRRPIAIELEYEK